MKTILLFAAAAIAVAFSSCASKPVPAPPAMDYGTESYGK